MNIVIKKNDSGFLATCGDVQGAMAEGLTPFDAFYNLVDVIKGIREFRSQKHENFTSENIEFSIPLYA